MIGGKPRLRRLKHRPKQSIVSSFCYPVDMADVLNQAADIAARDNLSFSEWLISIIEEKVQQEKNLAEASANPLNVTYVTRPIKTLDDILQGLTTLDDFMENSSPTSKDIARIEGQAAMIYRKAQEKYKEAFRREMFNRQ